MRVSSKIATMNPDHASIASIGSNMLMSDALYIRADR